MAPQGLSGKRGEGGPRASVLAGGGSFLVKAISFPEAAILFQRMTKGTSGDEVVGKVEIDKICFRGVFCEGLLN